MYFRFKNVLVGALVLWFGPIEGASLSTATSGRGKGERGNEREGRVRGSQSLPVYLIPQNYRSDIHFIPNSCLPHFILPHNAIARLLV